MATLRKTFANPQLRAGMNQSLPAQRAQQQRIMLAPKTTSIPPGVFPSAPPMVKAAGGGIPATTPGVQSIIPGTNMLPVSYNGNQRTYPVEVIINAAQAQYQFPDIQTLLGKRIIALESFSASEVTYGPISGVANIPQAAQKAMSIQLNDATNTALMDHHALVDFDPQLNNGLIRYIDFTNIVWTNCKLFLPAAANATIASPPYIAYFMIHYLNEG